jgi:predicted Zn finger-like uncharacterized protein
MRVVCPQCSAAYQIDDARIPDRGASVKCSRCQKLFPVRKGQAAGGGAVPLPGSAPAAPAGPRSVPLPQPPAAFPRAPPAPSSIPLPPPPSAVPPPFADPFAAAPAPSAGGEPSPFDSGPSGFPDTPFGAPDPFAQPDAGFPPADSPFAAGASPFADPGPFDGAPADPAPAIVPPPPPAIAPPPPAESLSFGEVDLGDAPLPAPPGEPPAPFPPLPSPDDPFDLTPHPQAASRSAAPAFPPPPVSAGGGAEELESLFGEAPRPAPAAATAEPARGGYQVRRRSGKVFGPFTEAQVVEMLSKGELLGNEDVSLDGETYTPIGAVPAFGAALRKATAEPATKPSAPAVFGGRMAGAKIVSGVGRVPLPRWVKPALLAAPVVLLLAAGVGAGFTKHGWFFTKHLLKRGDPVALANLASQARTALARGDFPSNRAALDHAAKAVVAAPGAPEAILLHAVAVTSLELGHGAPPAALAQARAAAEMLEREDSGEPAALATRLALALVWEVPPTAAEESALERALAKRKPDAELVALLARSALVRGDAAKAAAQAGKLSALEKGPRGPLFLAQSAILRRAPADARAALATALQRDPQLPAAHLELAALDEEAGELAKAWERLEPLAADAAKPRLSPAERSRVLAILGSIAGRDPGRAAEADALLAEAVAADPRCAESRLRLVLRRIQAGDAPGAVAASEAPDQMILQQPALAAARVRALALSGKMLDAAMLADQALAANPGRIEVMVAKAVTLVAAGKSDEGKKLYEDALARDPNAVEPRVALARFALASGDLARAGDLLAAAVQKGPRDASAQAATGELLLAKGDAAGAEAAFRKALQLDQANAPAEVGLARLALARGDVAAARASLGRALKYDPHNPDVLVERATLLWKAGELGPAQADLEAAIDVAPRHTLALTRLGAVLLQRGDAEGAVRRLTVASNEAPALVEARFWLGQALLARSETPSAIGQLRKAVELARTADNLIALGAAYEKSGKLADALDSYKAAAAVAPDAAEPQERIAMLLAQNGRCDQALPAFARAVELAPKVTRLRLAQAQCTAQIGKHEEAVAQLQELLRGDPRASAAHYLLARSLHESKGANAAVPYYERAAKEEPGNPMPNYYLGYIYKQRNQRAKATQAFKRFLALKPDAPERKDIEAEIEDLGGK